MKKVYSSLDRIHTQYLKEVLGENGIACILRNEFLGGAAGELPIMETWPELWVLDDAQAERAIELIAAVEAAQVGDPGAWDCPGCNETIEAGFDVCWQCGTPRPEHD